MINDSSRSIPEKDKKYLDLVLQGKSDSFKVKVYEIVRDFKMDANDPSFLLLVSTGRLEVLLDEFPNDLAKTLKRELTIYQDILEQTKVLLESQKADFKGYAQGIKIVNESFQVDVAKQILSLNEQNQALREEIAITCEQMKKEREEFFENKKYDRQNYQMLIEKTQEDYDVAMKLSQQAHQRHSDVLNEGLKVIEDLKSLQQKIRINKLWANVSDALPPMIMFYSILGSFAVGMMVVFTYYRDDFRYLPIIKDNQILLKFCFLEGTNDLNPAISCKFSPEVIKKKKGK